jgi:hypothetical protein
MNVGVGFHPKMGESQLVESWGLQSLRPIRSLHRTGHNLQPAQSGHSSLKLQIAGCTNEYMVHHVWPKTPEAFTFKFVPLIRLSSHRMIES